MNSHLLHSLFEHRGLYAPDSFLGTSEDIRCTDCIGVACVVTGYTTKRLSPSVFPCDLTTNWTRLRGVSGRNGYHENTVLLRLVSDPIKNPSIRPRCKCFPELFASFRLFTAFHVAQSFNANYRQECPRQQIDNAVDEICSLSVVTIACLRLWLAASNLGTDRLKFDAVVVAVRVRQELVDADIDAERPSFLGRFVRYFDPQRQRIFSDRAPLYKLAASKPLTGYGSVFRRYRDSLSRNKRRYLNDQIETSASVFNRDKLGIERGRTGKHRASCRFSDCLGSLACADNDFQRLFQRLRLVASGKFRTLKPCQRRSIKFAAFIPQRANVKIDSRSVTRQQGVNGPPLFGGSKLQGYFDGSSHGRSKTPRRQAVTGAQQARSPSATGIVRFSLSRLHVLY